MCALTLATLNEELEPAYLAFARAHFGPNEYQSTRKCLTWLYQENPLARKDGSDLLLCLKDDEVIGCIHKMRLPWRVNGRRIVVPSLQNWMVAPEHRTGVGALLLGAVFKSELQAFIPVGVGDLATIYRRLRCEEIQTSWYRKVLSPLGAAIRFALVRTLGARYRSKFLYETAPRTTGGDVPEEFRLDMAPDSALITLLAQAWSDSAARGVQPQWDPELMRWRFFHEAGPKHAVIYARDGARVCGFVIFSAGVRRDLVVGRVVHIVAPSQELFYGLMRAVEAVLRRWGVHVLLLYSADPRTNEMLEKSGWQPSTDDRPTFFYHANREERFSDFVFHASAADFGFESMLS